jgi:condensin complex subunit 3
MALSSFQLFISQVQSAPEELKARVLQVIFDLLFVYNQEFFGRSEDIVSSFYNAATSINFFHRLNKSLIFYSKP